MTWRRKATASALNLDSEPTIITDPPRDVEKGVDASDNEKNGGTAANALDIHGIGDMPGHFVRRLHQIATAHFAECTRDSGLTPVQYATLVAAQSSPGIDQRSLSGLVAFDRSTIGDVVQRLEQRGLLRREDGQIDRRAKQVFLSDKGAELLARIDPAVVASQKAFLSPLSDGEQAILMFLMRKLAMLSNDLSPAPLRSLATMQHRTRTKQSVR